MYDHVLVGADQGTINRIVATAVDCANYRMSVGRVRVPDVVIQGASGHQFEMEYVGYRHPYSWVGIAWWTDPHGAVHVRIKSGRARPRGRLYPFGYAAWTPIYRVYPQLRMGCPLPWETGVAIEIQRHLADNPLDIGAWSMLHDLQVDAGVDTTFCKRAIEILETFL